MMKVVTALVCLFTSITKGCTQEDTSKFIGIGEQFPGIVMGYHKNEPVNINRYKSRLVILDFWDPSCSSCFREFEKLDSLQQHFGSQVQFILVTRSGQQAIDQRFKNKKIKQPRNIPFLINDSILHTMLPYHTVPHHVWIDSSGFVRHIADGQYTNLQNIQTYLQGVAVNLPLKNEWADIDATKPLWLEGGGRLQPYLQAYSYFMQQVAPFSSQNVFQVTEDTLKPALGFKAINTTLMLLYQIAASQSLMGKFLEKNRVIVETGSQDSIATHGKVGLQTLLCYESKIPYANWQQLFTVLMQDLNRYFPYRAKIEKRKVPCLVLVQFSGKNKITHRSRPVDNVISGRRIQIKNQPFENLFFLIKDAYAGDSRPVLNDVNYTGTINLDLEVPLADLPALRRQLQNYNLDLVEQVRELEMMVLAKK